MSALMWNVVLIKPSNFKRCYSFTGNNMSQLGEERYKHQFVKEDQFNQTLMQPGATQNEYEWMPQNCDC